MIAWKALWRWINAAGWCPSRSSCRFHSRTVSERRKCHKRPSIVIAHGIGVGILLLSAEFGGCEAYSSDTGREIQHWSQTRHAAELDPHATIQNIYTIMYIVKTRPLNSPVLFFGLAVIQNRQTSLKTVTIATNSHSSKHNLCNLHQNEKRQTY